MVLHTRELDKSAHEAKQMTTAQAVGAVSREAAEWYAIDSKSRWPASSLHAQSRLIEKELQTPRVRTWNEPCARLLVCCAKFSSCGTTLALWRFDPGHHAAAYGFLR